MCSWDDRGDGMLVVVPAELSTATVLRAVSRTLAAHLRAHNAEATREARVALRVAVHAGDIHRDERGSVGAAVNMPFRLADAPPLRRGVEACGAELGVIVSAAVHEQIVVHGYKASIRAYQGVVVRVKETRARAWITVPGHRPPLPGVPARRIGAAGLVAGGVLAVAAGVVAAVLVPRSAAEPAGAGSSVPFSAYANYQLEGDPSAVHPDVLGRSEFPVDQDCHDVARWVLDHGGGYTSVTPVRLTLIGQGEQTIVVQRLVARVIDRVDAPAGTRFDCLSAGTVEPVPVTVDLDAPDPVARRVAPDGSSGAPFFADTVVELRSGEAVVFDIIPTTTRCLCAWDLELSYVADGELRTTVVRSPGGEPFRTSASEQVVRVYGALVGTSAWEGP